MARKLPLSTNSATSWDLRTTDGWSGLTFRTRLRARLLLLLMFQLLLQPSLRPTHLHSLVKERGSDQTFTQSASTLRTKVTLSSLLSTTDGTTGCKTRPSTLLTLLLLLASRTMHTHTLTLFGQVTSTVTTQLQLVLQSQTLICLTILTTTRKALSMDWTKTDFCVLTTATPSSTRR